MSKGSKRQSWKTRERIHNSITRDLAAKAAASGEKMPSPSPQALPSLIGITLPPNGHERARLRREAKKERLRARVREALASEQAIGRDYDNLETWE